MLRHDALNTASIFPASISRYSETLYERNGKQVTLRNNALHATSYFVVIPTPGRGGLWPPPGYACISGERQKKFLGRELAHFPRFFLAFVLPRRLITTPQSNSGTLFVFHANPVPQPRVQGTQYPGSEVRGLKKPPGAPGGWVREARSLPGPPGVTLLC